MMKRYGLGPEDAILVAAPVGHAIGFCYGVRLAAACGARMVLQPRWDAAQALELIVRHGCTFAAIPTPFLADLTGAGQPLRDHTLRHLIVGGAPVPRDQVAEADLLLGPGIVSGYYGASECGAVLSSPPGIADERRACTDGTPMPGVDVRIVDDEGADVPDGREGEMLVRGPQVALGYWANNDSDEQFRSDGWFATRDRAVRTADGFVSVTGRMKDVIFRGAVNVVPHEVEEALAGHPGIGFAVVLGTADRRLGERIVAVVTTPDRPPELEELRAWLANVGLARSKWPDEMHVVEEMPRTGSGKVDRARVRDELHGVPGPA
jgi:cyclohexanecarboxylate-CoA ligase